ncbi:hypothetical protein BLAHAN_06284 [Blautia hansenii DSM 20583]|uniref:Uncharacterized protein n=1 Tax=Blautia hansenii DSM 20583 TaxID=537007 RepID=C9LA35_BLAHA|nr:hypothetical protein BLAHAN_06284 [Blautia hansenii DSM 20583]
MAVKSENKIPPKNNKAVALNIIPKYLMRQPHFSHAEVIF